MLQSHDQSRRPKVGKKEGHGDSKGSAARRVRVSIWAIIAVLDKHEAEHTLTPEILEELAREYAAVAAPGVADHPRLGAYRRPKYGFGRAHVHR